MKRAPVNLIITIAAVMIGLPILILVTVHVHAARTNSRMLDQQCGEDASAFKSEADNLAAGSKVVGYTSHYNQQRHQCLVEISDSRPENGAMASKEQIFDPSDGTFVASCDRLSAGRGSSVTVLGAPVPLHEESAALAWFTDLMRN
jgi:hypothetical protein